MNPRFGPAPQKCVVSPSRAFVVLICRYALTGLVSLAATQAGQAKEKWDVIPAADLAAKESASLPGADVEILLSRQVLNSNFTESTIRHQLRAKIFTAKGVEDWGRFKAESIPQARVRNLAGRVVKADGTMLELQKADFNESVRLKYEGEYWKQTTFAFPNLAPGDIAECQWTEVIPAWLSGYRGFIQEEYPIREFQLTVENFPTNYFVEWEHCTGAQMNAKNGNTEMYLVVRNLPAFEKEELMPPEWDFRAGVLLIPQDNSTNSKKEWQKFSSDNSELPERSGAVKKKALSLIEGAPTADEKLRRLYRFCQNEITNTKTADTPEAKADREKRAKGVWDGVASPKEVLTAHRGWPDEINGLFAAMVQAIGLEVKETKNASRNEIMNVNTDKGWVFLDRRNYAVKVEGKWQFFSPGNFWVPYGMLDSDDEGVSALLCDEDKVIMESTPVSPAENTQAIRKGHFTLDAEGTLEGEVEEAISGHQGIALKSENAGKADDEIDRNFREELSKRLPNAAVTELHWDNLHTNEFPVTIHYKVRVSGYAEQAGKRLILSPGYFESGRTEKFTAENRKLPIFFPYAHEEHDEIEIILPPGFALDHPSAPLDVAAQEKTIGAHYQISYKTTARKLSYKRDFVLGGNKAISFQAASYPVLKQRFAHLHQSDTHALILKPESPAAITPPVVVPPHDSTPAGK